ncbi:hypothetical protein [Burkholderia sp. THE68]|uniref:hypothetical protein n=1 Tax=Burkholderia sp. THE68 TaxID=758782 RepID=UPI0013896539|nr:hypothetical protein [Burkholderia sp. THE68]
MDIAATVIATVLPRKANFIDLRPVNRVLREESPADMPEFSARFESPTSGSGNAV